jgi:sugar lactone lactonase YvrE
MAVICGHLSGRAESAFNLPFGMVTDSHGNVFVADTGNHTIRKIAVDGVVSTFAGTPGINGTTDGTGTAALFRNAEGIAIDSADNVYVADTYNHTIRKITPAGVVTTLAGTAGSSGSTDATGTAAMFSYPQALVLDSNGNIFVADSNNHTIRKIDTNNVVTTFAGSPGSAGTTDATGTSARLSGPAGIAIDAFDNLYVSDTNNHTIRVISPSGVVTTLAGTAGASGATDATGTSASFYRPQQLSIDSVGNLYVSDSNNRAIRKIDTNGVVTTYAGTAGSTGSVDGNGSAARFNFPFGVAVDKTSGLVYVSDTYNYGIRKIATNGDVSTIAAGPALSGAVDGTGSAARFSTPRSLAVDGSGNVYVADASNYAIRKVTTAGVVTTFAGTIGSSGSTDATGTSASFNQPYGIATDTAGNIYVADTNNNTIRQITNGGVVSTVAGGVGSWGSTDATGTAARFANPYALTADNSGNLYVADTGNHTVRKVEISTGVVTTLAGTAGSMGSTDGTGASALFRQPYGIAFDSHSGNIFLADTYNHAIRQITSSGVVSTLAGTSGTQGSTDGTGTAALFRYPRGIVPDGLGNLYVADTNNHTVRKIVIATQVVTTVLGTSTSIGFAGGALPGSLAYPQGVSLYNGTLYVSTRNGVVKATGF